MRMLLQSGLLDFGKTKTDFVGKRSLALPAMSAPGRKQLVGLLMVQESNGQLMRDFENAVMQAIVE